MKIYCHLYIPLLLLQAEADTPSNPIIKFLLEERAWLWPLLFTILTAIVTAIVWLIKHRKQKPEPEGMTTAMQNLYTDAVKKNEILESKIKELEAQKFNETYSEKPDAGKLKQLNTEIDALRNQLAVLISENEQLRNDVIAKTKGIQEQLTLDAANDPLKAAAAESLKRGDTANARLLLLKAAKEDTGLADTAEVIVNAKKAEAAKSYFQLAELDEKELRYADALKHYRQAASLQPQNGLYLNDLGNFLITMAHYNEAIDNLNRALKHIPADSQELEGTINNNLGLAYHNKGEYDKAIEYYQKAIAIDKKFYGEEHPEIAIDYNNLGLAYRNKGEYDKAIDYYQKALAIDKKFYGEEHPDIAIDYNNLGAAYDSKGEYDKAIDYYQKALAIDKKYHGEEHPNIATRYNNLGLAYHNKGEYDKAIDYYHKALVIGKKYHGEEHPNIAIRYNNLGFAYHNKGEYDKAIDYYHKALDILRKFHPNGHPYIDNLKEKIAFLLSKK